MKHVSEMRVGVIVRSPRDAIAMKCLDCTYDPCDVGSWRQQVDACDIVSCALHPYRPTADSSQPRRDISAKKEAAA